MTRAEQIEEGKKQVLSLLTKEFQTTKAIQQAGIKQGMFNNWNSYNKYLEILEKEKKAERIKTTAGILWKKK